MKKFLILLLLLASVSTLSCGSGGAGPANLPVGENPGIASVIRLLAAQYIAQVKASIYLKAKVLDGNGLPVANETVTFEILPAQGSTAGILSSTTAPTNTDGIASVRLDSTTPGFVTVQAKIGSGAGQVQSVRNTFYFSDYALTPPTPPPPTLLLEIDGNGNGIYNETDDYTLFKSSGDNQAIIRATVRDAYNMPLSTTVTFGSDSAYATFPQGNTKTTDKNGQAVVLLKVNSTVITSYATTLNITASAANGAANITTIFLNPVTIDRNKSSITATPSIIALNGTSTINTIVLLNTGGPAPDATAVNFTSDCGTITPFAQTTGGVATATFTAPATPKTCTVSAIVSGTQIGTGVNITATTALIVSPASQTITDNGPAEFTIAGGAPPYKITSSDTSLSPSLSTISSSGATFTVTVPYGTKAKTVTYTIIDSAGTVVIATLTVAVTPTTPAPVTAMTVNPSTMTLTGLSSGTADNSSFTITGGTAPYTVYSSNTAVVPPPVVSGSTFTINPNPVAVSTTVTLTVMDAIGTTATVTVTVTPASSSLAINPSAVSMKAGGSVPFNIIGGSGGPLTIVSSNTATATITNAACTANGTGVLSCPAGTTSFNVTGIAANATAVTITVIDVNGNFSATAAVTVN